MDKINFTTSINRNKLRPTCPCGKSNMDGKFVPDKNDTEKGYCHSCGKTFLGNKDTPQIEIIKDSIVKPTSFHEMELMNKSLKNYTENNFIDYSKRLFPNKNVELFAKIYGIGTSKHYDGRSTVFWQIDENNCIRGGKIMKFDITSAKRLQAPHIYPDVYWVHKKLNLFNFTQKQCLFGSHLLADKTKTVAIVEGEKTAFLMALADSSKIWVATGGKNNFKYELLHCLKGRKVIAYPDKGEFNLWRDKAFALTIYGISIQVSNLLEKSDNPNGWDLADQLITLSQTKENRPILISYPDEQLPYIKALMNSSHEKLVLLAKKIVPENDSLCEQEMVEALCQYKQIHELHAKDLILVMRMKNILDMSTSNRYYLFHSTPF